MALEDTPVEDEIRTIVEGPYPPVFAKWLLYLVLPDGTEVPPLKLLSVDIERDYLHHYTDLIVVDAVFGLGQYQDAILPHKENLKAELIRYPTRPNDPEGELPPPDDEGPTVYEMRAVLFDENSDVEGVTGAANQTQGEMDLRDLTRVHIQLLDPAIEEFQKMEVGGIYRDETPLNVVRYILTHLSDELDLADEDAVYGVDMVPPDNQTPNEHIVIPHGTKPWDVCRLVQRDWGGCYNAGAGCFLQNHHWYLWPEFNTTRFEDTDDTLTVFNIPPWRYRGIEKTWRRTNRQLIILATGDSEHLDESHHNQLNFGSGERFVHGDRIAAGFGETKDNRFTMKRASNNSEYVAVEKEGNVLVGVAANHVSNNSFEHVSQFASRKGSFVHLVWEYSRHELIYPGMPVKYHFLDNVGELMELMGVVVKAHHFIHDKNPGIMERTFICNTALTLFVDKYEQNQ